MAQSKSVIVRRKKIDLNKYRDATVDIGWFKGVRYSEGVSVAQVAVWNEYGTVSGKYRIPPRPFVRPAIRDRSRLSAQLRKLYARALSDNTNTAQALSQFGEYVVAKIQTQIDMVMNPPNSPVTIQGGWLRTKSGKSFYVEPKKGNKPLINTGLMRDSVSYKTEEKIR